MPGGRPQLFETAEQLDKEIQNYFSECDMAKKNATITGLAYYIGFESRQSFYDYEKHEEFSYVIKRARLYVESNYEELLTSGKPVGAIFALKNMGWKDKHEVTQEISGSIRTYNGIEMVEPDAPSDEVQT